MLTKSKKKMQTKIFRIYGPPGTGKTTALLNKVDEALRQGIPPSKIGYFAFTRQAAYEAVERACQRFGLDETQLPWFRTLHSFALRLSGIRSEQVMQNEHYRELSSSIGIRLMPDTANGEDNIFDSSSNADPYLSIINLARLKKIPLRKQYNLSDSNIDWMTLSYVARSLQSYKSRLKVYDFTDMLEIFVNESSKFCPNLSVSFIDEAQDLSPLQWDVAHVIEKHSDKIYCAGDDDQAIYKWAGADVEHFIGLNGGYEVLEQSYRVPQNIHPLASRISKRIHKRVPKTYLPRQEDGSVKRINDISHVDLSEGTWLILAQAGYFLNGIVDDLKSRGHLFSYYGHRSISQKISEAVNGWEQMRKGREITAPVARIIYSYMSVGNRVKRGFKKIPHLMDDETVTLEALQRDHGLFATIDMIWHDAMDKIPDSERAYITALLRRGEKFNGTPRITLSTIHGSKGGEAENVVLFTDVSPAASKAAEQDPDELHRVFYVGVTRTKKNLYLIEPEDALRSYII